MLLAQRTEQAIGRGGLAAGGERLRAQRLPARRQWLRVRRIQRDQRVGRAFVFERLFGQRDRARGAMARIQRVDMRLRRGGIPACVGGTRGGDPGDGGVVAFAGGARQQLLGARVVAAVQRIQAFAQARLGTAFAMPAP